MTCHNRIIHNSIPLRRMLGISILLLMTFHVSQAQTWNEWFRQKRTQKKYLAKQVALLKIYLDQVKEGYEIVGKGLTTIRNIKNGDFSLHRDFFSSLKKVNPSLANSAKVADIIAYQAFIVKELRKVNNFCRQNKHFTAEEARYLASVYSNMLRLSDESVSELLTILTPGKMEMKDDERLSRIDIIYDDMLDKHAFTQAFKNDVYALAMHRENELHSVGSLKSYYNLEP